MTTSTVSAGILDVPGAHLHYEVRGSGPLVALVGAPMDANAFAPLAELLATDHTVLTTDPRGINRSVLDDPDQDSTPELRADDLSRLLAHVNAGPAMVFGSSGGAVTALALVQTHPEQVHTVIAHEPPIVSLLANRDEVHAGTQDQIETYLGGDVVGAWKKFFAQANLMAPEGMIEMIFGGVREPQVVADELRWFAHELSETTHWEPDFSALRTASTRIVIGIGSDSTDQQCDRTSRALAAALGSEPAMFPGGHTGCAELPEDFAARLREI